MFSTTRSSNLGKIITSTPSASLPSFLVPAASRCFSQSTTRSSQIGRAALSIPPEVNFSFTQPVTKKNSRTVSKLPTVTIQGPLGTMVMPVPEFVKIEHDQELRKAYVSVQDKELQKQREMWGTTRAYLHNHILGVSEGHTAILRLVGVGYRATVENTAVTKEPEYEGQQFVVLKVGYSHPIELGLPKGVKASTPQPTRILLEGIDKPVLMQYAAQIRRWRVPEPYKGKGIFVNGETIKLKAKKIK